MHDSYIEKANLKQIRSEISLVRAGDREIGFWGAFGTGGDEVLFGLDQVPMTLEPTDLYVFFVRHYFSGGGEGRLWSGASGDGDALFGGDIRVPLGTSWALENSAGYLLPKQGRGSGGQQEESWGVSIQLVWYPGRASRCVRNNPSHPLFNVADNSVFMVDTR